MGLRKNTCIWVSFKQTCRPSVFIEERLQHRCFPVKFAKFSTGRWWLLLKVWEMPLLNERLLYNEATSPPEQFWKKDLPSSYREKMRWERGWQLKPCLHLIYFHYSFATRMANMSPNIFISNVLLNNPTERNA